MSTSIGATDDQPGQEISADLAETIEKLAEGDIARVNHSARIWTIAEVVDTDLPEATRRTSQRGIRLTNTPRGSDPIVHALIVDRYPDRVEAALHVLESDRPGEVGEVRPVEHVERTNGKIPWVVLQRSTTHRTWHRPHPGAVMHGLAEPACRNYPTMDDYRFVKRKAVETHYKPCKDCFLTWTPVEPEPVACPKCETPLSRILLDGRHVDSISTVHVDCPVIGCTFSGDVSLSYSDTPI